MTPADITEKEFSTSLRGLNQDEVYAFLDAVAQEWEQMERQNERLKSQIKDLRDKLAHHEEKEDSLNKTLTSIEQTKNDAKELARREAELIRSEAEVEAEKILRQMEMRRQMLMEEIRSLETFYARLRSRLKVILDTFSDLIKTPEELREEIRLRPPTEVPKAGPVSEDG